MTDSSFELLETMKWTPEEGFWLLDRHIERLSGSAKHFGFACSVERIRQALDAAVRPLDRPQRVRLLVARDATARVESSDLVTIDRPLRVGLARSPIDPRDDFLYHKTTRREIYDRHRRSGLDDVILWNPAREVTESTIANVVVERDGIRVTPPVACGLLAGTFRAELLARGEIGEGRVTVDECRRAARIWLVNSVRGWCSAVLIEG